MARREVALYNFKDKKSNVRKYINYMLNRTNNMFKYDNLPENIDARMLELQLQTYGFLVVMNIPEEDITQYDESAHIPGGIYALPGGMAGVVDLNNRSTFVTVTHPRLKKSYKLKIGEECVIIRNDSLMLGLLPMFERYATQLVENDITMNLADIQSRIISLLKGSDDSAKNTLDIFLNKIIDGDLSAIVDTQALIPNEAIATLPYTNNANSELTNLIELQQYLKASWYNEIGLSANYNMKRESINSSEAQLGKDSLLPLIDDMLHCREQACEEISKLFGVNMSVDFHSAWKHTNDEMMGDEVEPDPEETTGSNEASETTDDKADETTKSNTDKTTEDDIDKG